MVMFPHEQEMTLDEIHILHDDTHYSCEVDENETSAEGNG